MRSRGRVTSADSTPIVFERFGEGQPIIMVGGALQPGSTFGPWAAELARDFAVYTYDRRGRGYSGDTPPYAVEREIEDLEALIAATGGTAAVYGHSSGAALVLHAAARGLAFDRMVLHEPPFGSGGEEETRAEQEQAEQIKTLLAQTGVATRSPPGSPAWGAARGCRNTSCRPRSTHRSSRTSSPPTDPRGKRRPARQNRAGIRPLIEPAQAASLGERAGTG